MANKFSLWINVKYCRRYVSKQHLTVHKHSLNDKPKILVPKILKHCYLYQIHRLDKYQIF